MYLYLNSLGAVVRALCAFLYCSLLTTTVFTHVFIEQINDDDDDESCLCNCREIPAAATGTRTKHFASDPPLAAVLHGRLLTALH